MRNDKEYTSVAQPPKRQGFYEVTLDDGTECIAEWREQDKKDGKQWWRYVSDDPTVEKTPVLLTSVKAWRPALKEQIEQALKRELTKAERIEAAVADHLRHFNLYRERVDCYPRFAGHLPVSRHQVGLRQSGRQRYRHSRSALDGCVPQG
jgi:hypothetical protein